MNTRELEIARKAFEWGWAKAASKDVIGFRRAKEREWEEYAKTLETSKEDVWQAFDRVLKGHPEMNKPQLPEALAKHVCTPIIAPELWHMELARLMLEEVKKIAEEEAYQRGCQCQSQINLHYEQACDKINGVERAFEKLEKRLLAEMGQANVEHNLHMQEVEKRLEAKIDAAKNLSKQIMDCRDVIATQVKADIAKALRDVANIDYGIGVKTMFAELAKRLDPPDSHDEEKRKDSQHMATAIFGGMEE